MAVYKAKPERVQRTMIGALVAVLLLTAGQAMAQLTSEGNQFWSQDSDGIAGKAEEFDFFGDALAAGDFNNDGFEDLAIGVPFEDIGGILIDSDFAGVVNVIYGGPPGLAAPGNQIWHQDSDGIAGVADFLDFFGDALAAGATMALKTWQLGSQLRDNQEPRGQRDLWRSRRPGGPRQPDLAPGPPRYCRGGAEAGDFFGNALAAADFNNDGFADLAIGVPEEDIGGVEDAGAVNVIYGGPGGLAAPGNQIWHQDRFSIDGEAEADDSFGEALATGDFNNDGFEDLAIGVPGENTDVGAVNVIYGGPSGGLAAPGNRTWNQNSVSIAGQAGAGDNFGQALAAGHFNNDGFEDLAIGVPGENTDVGAVNVIYGGPGGLAAPGNQFWHQDSFGIAEQREQGDNFGSALAAGNFNRDGFEDLAIGVPVEDIGGIENAGAVNVLYGAANAGPIQFSREGIVNAASFLPGAAPAAIMSLFGVNLARATEVASEVPLPTLLAGTTVRVAAQPVLKQTPPQGIFGSALARLFFAPINFLCPRARAGHDHRNHSGWQQLGYN